MRLFIYSIYSSLRKKNLKSKSLKQKLDRIMELCFGFNEFEYAKQNWGREI